MPRARTIWIVTEKAPSPPVAAFTVKHELVSWLRRQTDPAGYLLVFRTPDAMMGVTTRMRAKEVPIKELLET